jgi:hypothetical protein
MLVRCRLIRVHGSKHSRVFFIVVGSRARNRTAILAATTETAFHEEKSMKLKVLRTIALSSFALIVMLPAA